MKKDKPIQILDHIHYRDEALLKSNKFKIASNFLQRMLDKNFSICFLSPDTKLLFIALNEKEKEDLETIKGKGIPVVIQYVPTDAEEAY